MKCYVYKGARKQDHFLFLAQEFEQEESKEGANAKSEVPIALLEMLGELSLIVEIELHENKKLAQAEAAQVLADIERQGFYLQMPKRDMRAEEDRVFS